MAFSEAVIINTFIRSGGRCQCRQDHPEHRGHGRCRTAFEKNEGWIARRVIRNGPDARNNCELVCPLCDHLIESRRRRPEA